VKKTWIVLKTEFLNTVTRRSFILALILVPLVPAIILGVMSLLKTKEPVGESGVSISVSQIEEQLPQGYVDLAKIVNSSPEWLGEDVLLLFHQESEAVDAILTAKIRGYFVIQPDYLESGSVRYISREFNPVTSLDSTWTINSLIQYNLLGEDIDQFDAFFFPLHVQYIDLAPDEAEIGIDIGKDPYAFYIPYGMTMLFYVLILTSASLMMNSVAKEKENRVMEILVSSVNPRQLLTGKILGLGSGWSASVGGLVRLCDHIDAFGRCYAENTCKHPAFSWSSHLGHRVLHFGLFTLWHHHGRRGCAGGLGQRSIASHFHCGHSHPDPVDVDRLNC
jgi:ABC-2 type transport system permease protein